MQKKSKKILTAVVTALFVLSISYFALLAPTTAWFYQSDTKSYAFKFGDFKMDETVRGSTGTLTVPLRAATRFADAGEILFDEVIHVVKVDVENLGGVTGQVVVNVNEDTNNPDGLRWFIYDTAQNEAGSSTSEIPDVAASSTAAKGGYKTAIEAMLMEHNVTPVSFSGESAYATYNATAVTALEAHNAEKIIFSPGEEKVIYVVFWAEYGEVKSDLLVDTAAQNRSAVTLGNYVVSIDFEGSPYVPEYQTLQIINNHTGTINVRLYLNGNTTEFTGVYKMVINNTENTYSAAGGVIGIPVGSTMSLDLEVGTPFKVSMVNNASGAHFENSRQNVDIGTVTGVRGTIITDTISNIGNIITIETTT